MLEDCSNLYVSSEEELLALFVEGSDRRQVGATLMNASSSRSHMLTFLKLTTTEPGQATMSPTLVLVDLAGSERVTKSKLEGQQLGEGVTINKSLSALGLVIDKLAKGNPQAHIPYRDSKLTRLLQQCFGGRSVCCLICNVSGNKSLYSCFQIQQ